MDEKNFKIFLWMNRKCTLNLVQSVMTNSELGWMVLINDFQYETESASYIKINIKTGETILLPICSGSKSLICFSNKQCLMIH